MRFLPLTAGWVDKSLAVPHGITDPVNINFNINIICTGSGICRGGGGGQMGEQ